MDLSIVSQDADVAQLKIRGRVTQRQLSSSADLLVDLLGSDVYTRKVLIDMRDTEFMDSSGISWLLIAHKRFREKGGRFVLYALPPMVMNVLKVLKMQLVFELAGTHDEALEKVRGNAP
jgi:anti-anti-sigma factor